MAHLFMGLGAAAGGAAGAVGGYNRENFMWDEQNKQNRVFQMQNMLVSQFSLYREDIRDLFAVSYNKMSSYLVVSTLMLGFIVTVFWNFDRTDDSLEKGEDTRTEGDHEIEALFTMHMMSSFAFLITSLWFAMQTITISQSFMTKILVETLRIPLPNEQEITGAAAAAADFELAFQSAFRVPLLSKIRNAMQETSKKSAFTRNQPIEQRTSLNTRGVDINELPHIKLYRELMKNWLPFDFYCQVCQSIGVSTLLSGLSYYVLYYQGGVRYLFTEESVSSHAMDPDTKHHAGFGLLSYICLSLLTFWQTHGSLDLPWFHYVLLSTFLSGSPVIVVMLVATHKCTNVSLYFVIIICNASWVCMLCYLALAAEPHKLSVYWTAARYTEPFGQNERSQDQKVLIGEKRNVHEYDSDSSDSDVEAACRKQDDDEWIDSLACYGGQRVESLKSYVAQFQPHYSVGKDAARKRFKELSMTLLLMWVVVFSFVLLDDFVRGSL